MKAMIFAAGEGRRMMPLTAQCPKPLLEVAGKPLICHQIEKLRLAGINDIVINVSYMSEMLMGYLGAGDRWGVSIVYSQEQQALETGGGILRALPLLGDAPFMLVNADVWSDIDYVSVARHELHEQSLGYLVLVNNPPHHPKGDFYLNETGRLSTQAMNAKRLTFSGVSVIRPQLVAEYPECRERFALVEALRWAINGDRLSGVHHSGDWLDVGTPQRFEQLKNQLDSRVCLSVSK